MKNAILRLSVILFVFATILSPKPAVASGYPLDPPPGHCIVWASVPHHEGGYVVGFGENRCAYPALIRTTYAGIHYKKCRLFVCWWTPLKNLKPMAVADLWRYRDFADVLVPWEGRHTYQVYTQGSCYFCRSKIGGEYGPEIKLR